MKYLSIIALLLYISACSLRPKVKTGYEGKLMPSFELLMADSITRFNTASIPSGKPIVLFSFEPWCPYCRAQTEDLVSHIQSMKDINFYMLCDAPFPDFKNFYDHYELKKYPNMHAGVDDNLFFAQYFKTNQIPYLAVYDKQKKLKQVLIGKTDLNIIKKIASE